jgi:hypothetical protein
MHPGYVSHSPSDRMKRFLWTAVILVVSALVADPGLHTANAADVPGGPDLEVAWTFDTGG